ncbi:hypothetical protein FGB62_60g016 [Gracilaria domingensis]|nr:hypothetical protein FGB62_60g016 [Gracilaria domingensis]
MSSPTPTGTHSSSAASSSSVHDLYGEEAFSSTAHQHAVRPYPNRFAASSPPPEFRETVAAPSGGFTLRLRAIPHHPMEAPVATAFGPITDTSREEWAFSPRCSAAVVASGADAAVENAPEAVLPGLPCIPLQLQPCSQVAEVPRPRRYLSPMVVPMQRTYLVSRWASPPMPTRRGRKRDAYSISADRIQPPHAVASPLPPTIAPSAPGPSPKRRRVHYVDREHSVASNVRHETCIVLASGHVGRDEAAGEPRGQVMELQGVRASGNSGRGTRRAYAIESPSSSLRRSASPAAAASVPHEQSGQVVGEPSAEAVSETGDARGAYVIGSPRYSEYRDDSYAYVADDAVAEDLAAPVKIRWAGRREDRKWCTVGVAGVDANGGGDGAADSASWHSSLSSGDGSLDRVVEPTVAPLERVPDVFLANVWCVPGAEAAGFNLGLACTWGDRITWAMA